MGLAQDTQAAVTHYEDTARAAVHAVHNLAATVAELADQVAPSGPLGASTDPDVARARARLATAGQRLLSAGEAVAASRATARSYANRVFPQ